MSADPSYFDMIVRELNKRLDDAEDQEQSGKTRREREDEKQEMRGDEMREKEGGS